MYTPYTYLLGWTSVQKFYYGVRYAKASKCLYTTGCHPDDLWTTYFTSSSYVKELRQAHGEPDIVQIRKTFRTQDAAVRWEEKVIRRANLLQRTDFLNKNASGAIINDDDVCRKISAALRGKKKSPEHIGKMSILRRKENLSPETRKRMSLAQSNKKLSRETCEKKAYTMSKLIWYTDGTVSKRLSECPDGWVKGRTSFQRPNNPKELPETTKQAMRQAAKHRPRQTCHVCGLSVTTPNYKRHMKSRHFIV